MRGWRVSLLMVVTALLIAPAAALAQSGVSGTIAGVARDATGGVLPGVTVEASSPALIEKVRTAVTDDQGQYKIVDLRPGTYAVTFTLAGFSTFKREGIELTTGFTATANAELTVGSLQETVTVSGASPVVDIQNVRTQNVMSREMLDTLPTGKTTQGFQALTLGARGASQDVGGNTGEAPTGFGVHGTSSGDGKHLMDGMQMTGPLYGSGLSVRLNFVNQLAVQEVAMTYRGASAESETGGPQINYVPKEGGNRYSLSLLATGANSSMQSDRLTDELKSQGLTSAPSIKRLHDVGGGVGGPLREDTLWFFSSVRTWNSQSYVPGMFFQNKQDPAARGGLIYIPDRDRPAYSDNPNKDVTGRLTWQVSPKNKVAISQNVGRNCHCYQGLSGGLAPEASLMIHYNSELTQVTWNSPRTNRLLFEGGFTGLHNVNQVPRADEVATTDPPVQDLGLGISYNARGDSVGENGNFLAYSKDILQHQANGRFTLSYVTGSHAFKTGFTLLKAWQGGQYKMNDPPVKLFLRNGVPLQLQQWIDPVSYHTNVGANLGLYAQDQWTISRMTVNLGLRFDYLNAYTPEEHTPAGLFVPERNFEKSRSDLVSFKDINPRLGAAYDLRGDGKTALKWQAGRYIAAETTWLATLNHPAYRLATNATRTWTDADGDFVPDCDLRVVTLNGECGPLSNVNLGQTIPTTSYADDVMRGFGNRVYNWQMSASIQHELRPNLGVMAGYYRTWYGNFTVTDNRAVAPSNYDQYCFTAPLDPALPGGGGERICGLYNLNPTRFGLVDNLVAHTSDYGTRTEVYNGFDLSMSARFGRGGLLQGGVASGQTAFDNCAVVDSPQQRFCRTKLPFKGQTQYKASVIYPLPYGIQASGVLQNLPGVSYGSTLTVTSAQVQDSLGRALSGGSANVTLVEPSTMFGERLTQVDMRFTKNFRFGTSRLQANIDLYNLFDSRAVLSAVGTYGARWRVPSSVLAGRMLKLGAQFDF